jgi:outer membrane protein assembly factor BamB
MRIASLAFVAIGMVLLLTASLHAQTANHHAAAWSRFRGPEGCGIASETPVPWPWNFERSTRIPLPGSGVGSPVVWENQAFVISASSDDDDATRHVIATDWTQGTIAWHRSYPSRTYTIHKFSSYASSTPAVDASGVVVAWGDPEHVMVMKFTHAGQELWSRDLGPYVSEHGFGASPILVDGLVILLNSQDAEGLEQGVAPGEDRMIALDSQTGSTVWETPLRTRRVCYGSPTIRRVGDATELVCATTGQGIFGMDLRTGEIRWSHDCFRLRVCASMLLAEDLAIASHGSMGGKDNLLVAYDMKQGLERFRIQRAAPYVPTPLFHNGRLFLWSDAGIVSCVSVEDGTVRWSERIGGNFFSSPIIVGDAMVNVSDVGQITAVAAGENFKNLGTMKIDAKVRSTLAATSSSWLLRAEDALWVIHP